MSLCVSCQKPLVLEIDFSDDDEDVNTGGDTSVKVVPDDVALSCGCHFHWQCLLETYNVAECPNCSKNLITSSQASGAQEILCNVHNEGGLEENFNIYPTLVEETYLKAYPDERKSRAFIAFCREGDVQAVLNIIQAEDEDEDDSEPVPVADLLRYQDPIGDMQSALHAAVLAGSPETAWLLLFMASNLDVAQFPPQVIQEAAALGISRESAGERPDIRSLKDSQGRTAEQLAAEGGDEVWGGWVGTQRLAI